MAQKVQKTWLNLSKYQLRASLTTVPNALGEHSCITLSTLAEGGPASSVLIQSSYLPWHMLAVHLE